ncbi:hypothetical protein CcaverHIS002_0408940 [Cutaneotrichosporon cavernicola]|uniref:Uncharacterized protein n=1 Tax=Cutaneotrichosporon cavernicola TaxID=279322 RepID=A0AA48L525_9TREE|nr:uncharacterized protein CcaverHIS019_0408880 [Cutaneotrichosporon cavernicola]BEI84290.1 hypothetical protein CcaverHIS002_0408940 [Cutaneotrichosporon cavernicola]BEI92068.1 hypothetical protein CcaverHIS019_0408880 [Cutaneotrichosporon cavernicola]BEI99838.1 hypothetical protein CcaverHIS631_0408810 [Cutaneotrichosporon cavernicola]BEJ07614.1 hypothetical protein CcaverHIS641_0408830 [Cutaneotrichosporon cavernicola]
MGDQSRTKAEVYDALAESLSGVRKSMLELSSIASKDDVLPAQGAPAWFVAAQAQTAARMDAMQVAINERFNQQDRVLRRILIHQRYDEIVRSARYLNAPTGYHHLLTGIPTIAVEPADTALAAPLPEFTVPAGFPNTVDVLCNMRAAQVDALLVAYSLPTIGTLEARRSRLKQFIGLIE